jgi:hypothetical protein
MNTISLIEENALTYYKGLARLLGGHFTETEEIAWFTTGRQSLYRFNGVLRTATQSLRYSTRKNYRFSGWTGRTTVRQGWKSF